MVNVEAGLKLLTKACSLSLSLSSFGGWTAETIKAQQRRGSAWPLEVRVFESLGQGRQVIDLNRGIIKGMGAGIPVAKTTFLSLSLDPKYFCARQKKKGVCLQ